MNNDQCILLDNAAAVPLTDIPVIDYATLRSFILGRVAGGAHVASMFAVPGKNGEFTMYAVLVLSQRGKTAVAAATMDNPFYSLVGECPAVHAFEREMAEQWHLVPLGHPWLKPLRFQKPFPGAVDKDPGFTTKGQLPSVMDFYRTEGEEVHEVAVGPVHAGVIEPGHFRFQCTGERVGHLEISLGYQHRGLETRLWGGPDAATPHIMETLAGDTTCGHSFAYTMNLEALAGISTSTQVHRVRAIALELERLANHAGDLGALAGDVGFLPTASFCGRLRGDFLNLTAKICGNRFGRGLAQPGGLGVTVDAALAKALLDGVQKTMKDVRGAVRLMFESPSATARFEDVGTVSADTARMLGLVGPAARASGLLRDIRLELPVGVYSRELFELPAETNGDVLARAAIRHKEMEISTTLLESWLTDDCDVGASDPQFRAAPSLHPNSLSVSFVEGWRGEICHTAITDDQGHFTMYKIVDPSFHNWQGLALAMRGQQISDFPICNKSFNLSYCGHDL